MDQNSTGTEVGNVHGEVGNGAVSKKFIKPMEYARTGFCQGLGVGEFEGVNSGMKFLTTETSVVWRGEQKQTCAIREL